jgi:predicted nucleic-acid-binding protein
VAALAGPYGDSKADILHAFQVLLDNAAFSFGSRETVSRALQLFAGSKAGFADCLIAAKNETDGCGHTASFDKGMRGLGSVKLL